MGQFELFTYILIHFITEATTLNKFDHFAKNVSSTLDLILNDSTYDRRLRPDFGGPPTKVEVNLHVLNLGPISENDQMYTMDIYFRQLWYDRRLRWEVPGLDEFAMSWLSLEKIWKPDTYFVNGKKSDLRTITSTNAFFRLRRDGHITYSMRLTVAASCKMRLRKYPMDVQKCPLVIGSYGYTKNDLVYNWSPRSISVGSGLTMPQFVLSNVTTVDNKIIHRGEDEYSVVKADFFLKRTIGFFVLQIYIPCSLLVLCSWISFWIVPGDGLGRCILAVMTVLSIATFGLCGKSQFPQISQVTALDWWFLICFIFVLSVLMEYATINYIGKRRIKMTKLWDLRELLKAESVDVPQTTLPSSSSSDIKIKDERKEEEHVSAFVDVEGAMTRQQKQWKSVPDVFDPQNLDSITKEDCLKNVRRSSESLRQRFPKNKIFPILYRRESQILPSGVEVKSGFDGKTFSRIDIVSRKVYPACFTVFVLVYIFLYAFYIQDDILEEWQEFSFP